MGKLGNEMLKKIRNVYEYLDYKIILNDDFLARHSGNHHYSLRAYSRDLDLSPSFISDVLRGKRELSPKKGRLAFERLGFKLAELDYIEDLITIKGTKDPILKQERLESVNRVHKKAPFANDSTKDLLMKDVDYFLIHGIVGGESKIIKLIELAQRVGIPKARTLKVIKEMTERGYFRKHNDEYFIENMNLNIPDHSRIFELQKQFSARILDTIAGSGGMRMPEQMGHVLVMGFDKDTFPMATEAYKQLVNTLCRLSNQSETAERFAFFSSSFFSTKS